MTIIEQAPVDLTEAEAELVLAGNRHLRQRTPLFNVYVLLAIVPLIGAIISRRPEIIGLGAPFAVAILASFLLYTPLDAKLTIRFGATRVTEGSDLTLIALIDSESGLARVEMELFLSSRLEAISGTRTVTSVARGATRRVEIPIRANEWGMAGVDLVTLRVTDRFGLFGGRLDFRTDDTIRIGIPDDQLQASLEADRFRRIVGSHASNDRGGGLEIADIRPYQPGDPAKAINWRITNRRKEPWVTLRHPDRSTTVVIIVDAHEGDDDEQRGTQRRSVSAALALARTHLALHDQVGLLVVGHTLRWLAPKLGRNQLFGIADELVAVSNAPDASLRLYRSPAVASIPSDAIIVALSPLYDPLMAGLIAEMRSHGNPVSLLMPEVTKPEPPRFQLRSRRSRFAEEANQLAWIERSIAIQMLRDRGVAMVTWADDEPVSTVIRTMQRLRQSMLRGRPV